MSSSREPGRRTPAKGVRISSGGPNWVFLTVSTNQREPWLTLGVIQQALHDLWLHRATAWLVSDYLLMPDHLHLFCAPAGLRFAVERWIAFWKDQFAKARPDTGKFQEGGFHHRLRDDESYTEKGWYVRMNPVRKGLVEQPEDWPYQGRCIIFGDELKSPAIRAADIATLVGGEATADLPRCLGIQSSAREILRTPPRNTESR